MFNTFQSGHSGVQLISKPQYGDAWSLVGSLYGDTFDSWLVSIAPPQSLSVNRTIEGIRLLDDSTGDFYIYMRNLSSNVWTLHSVQNPSAAGDYVEGVSDRCTLLKIW